MTPFRFASSISSDSHIGLRAGGAEMYFSQFRVKQLATMLLITAPALMLSSPNPSHASGAKPDIGEDIFKNRCTICHGVDGSGRTTLGKKLKIPDLRSDEVQKLSDDKLIEIITNGKGDMPAFKKKLSLERIQYVIMQLRKLKL